MAKFYGQVSNGTHTTVSRRGFSYIRSSAQSWDNSIITTLHYNDNDELIVNLEIADGSEMYGTTVFSGTIEELKEKLK